MSTQTYTDAPQWAEEAEHVIAGWGSTLAEAVDTLVRLDVTGHPEQADDCAIFHGLRKAGIPVTAVYTPYTVYREGDAPVEVAGYIEFEAVSVDDGWHVPAFLPLPAVASELATAFDQRLLPELEAA